MSDDMVRCVRCHGVYEAGLEACPRCGTTYRPLPIAPAPDPGSYADKYHGTPFAMQVEATAAPIVPSTGPRPGIVVALGAMMIVLALVVGGLYAVGAFGGDRSPAPALIFGTSQRPSPTPTLPPSVATTLSQLRDMNLSAHIKIQSRATLDVRVNGSSQTVIVTMDAVVSGGDESGTMTVGGSTVEFRLVNGSYYNRVAPTGKWVARSVIPPAMLLTPLFGITDAKMLRLVGPEMRDGQTLNHLQTTDWWVPDQSRISLFDVGAFGIKATRTMLDLWTTPDGKPVAASFSGTQDAQDGTHLLKIDVNFVFDQVGTSQVIDNPMAKPSPKASPT